MVYGWLSKYDPFLSTLNIRCRTIIGIQKRTIILTTIHAKPWPTILPSILDGLVEAEARDHGTEVSASSHECRDDCELLTVHERHNAIPGGVLADCKQDIS